MSKSDFDFEGDNEAIFDEKGTPNVDGTEEEEATESVDDEYYMDEDTREDEEVEEEEAGEETEEEEEVTVEKEEVEGDDPYQKIREDTIKALPDGEDTLFVVKGKEYRAADIPAKEWVNILQKGLRADQLFSEMGDSRRSLEQERELVRRNNEQAQRILDQYGQGGKDGQKQTAAVPDFLKPNELDTDEMRLLKQYAADVTHRVTTLETGVQSSEVQRYEGEILTEVKTLAKEYPVASVDEVLAVKSLYPREKLDELMRLSNQYYSGLEFQKKAREANPTVARELDEAAVKAYLAKKGKSKAVGVKRSRTSGGQKVSTKPSKEIGLNFGFDDAEENSVDYLKEMSRLRNL